MLIAILDLERIVLDSSQGLDTEQNEMMGLWESNKCNGAWIFIEIHRDSQTDYESINFWIQISQQENPKISQMGWTS